MFRERIYTGTINPNSIFLILVLFLGLQIFQNPKFEKLVSKDRSIPFEISVSQNTATISSGIPFHLFQISWISNKDNFKLLSFDKTQFLDNKKTDLKVSLLDNIRENSTDILSAFIQYHLFPPDNDESPVLS